MNAIDDDDLDEKDANEREDDAPSTSEERPRVPAPGEIERLRSDASARANRDGIDALRMCANANKPFESVDDACARLMPFHVFAAPDDVGWHGREDDAEDLDKLQDSASGGARLSREDCWVRDVENFAPHVLKFMTQSSASLPRPTTGEPGTARPVLSSEEEYLVERLTCEYARRQYFAEKIDAQVVSGRSLSLDKEIRRYEEIIRQRAASALVVESPSSNFPAPLATPSTEQL